MRDRPASPGPSRLGGTHPADSRSQVPAHLHLVTGKMARRALDRVVAAVARERGFSYSIQTMPISVAALMTVPWIVRHLQPHPATTQILLPGYCQGDLEVLQRQWGLPVQRGPKDLAQLPIFFGDAPRRPEDYGAQDIQILAEINHANRMSWQEIFHLAQRLTASGADVIDLGCDPGADPWLGVGDCVRSLRDHAIRVSIDSFHPEEVAAAVRAGAELVLSVHSANRQYAPDWNCEVVAIPDDPGQLDTLDATVAWLEDHQVPYRIDPILEPIGCGFARSVQRYLTVRERYPRAEMLMGIGNLTEMTDADSAGINVLLLGICQELAIRSVLTTQVIGWAQSAVRECDLARRLVHYAHRHQVPAKHLEPNLVLLRDPDWIPKTSAEIAELTQSIRDPNLRILVGDGEIHVVSRDGHWQGRDPYALFDQIRESSKRPLEGSHLFYLGYELAKAVTAITLGKTYVQDEALRWGFLTVEENSHWARQNHGR